MTVTRKATIPRGVNRVEGRLEKRGDAGSGFGDFDIPSRRETNPWKRPRAVKVNPDDFRDLTRSFRSFNTNDPADHYTLRGSAFPRFAATQSQNTGA